MLKHVIGDRVPGCLRTNENVRLRFDAEISFERTRRQQRQSRASSNVIGTVDRTRYSCYESLAVTIGTLTEHLHRRTQRKRSSGADT